MKTNSSKGRSSQVPRKTRVDGQVQAPNHDPSVGNKDRVRGARAKGGKRLGKKWGTKKAD